MKARDRRSTGKGTGSTSAEPSWLETSAEVTGCKYLFARMNTLTLGIPAGSGRFLITFTYYAHGRTYTGQFTSPDYLEQGSTFMLSYNPLAPRQNSKSAGDPGTGSSLFAIGIAGSIILSVLYLAWIRGCN